MNLQEFTETVWWGCPTVEVVAKLLVLVLVLVGMPVWVLVSLW